jgi:hypothetical protein
MLFFASADEQRSKQTAFFGEESYDTTRMCRSFHAFLLTPKKD